ncbi:MAG: (2Fe-2S)-binding protein [Candidatus Aminicenantes bacterium]|nr:(2Fe-2S)-binding protein [Candidatus Aminicenantes bacterium]
MMVSLVINGQRISAAPGTTILEAAREAGIEIPHLCYHPAFPPVGTCRLCAVEIEGLPKLEPACSTNVKEGMVVRTESPRVVEARRNVLELLLAEHAMDCPICDKAGECRLQDTYQAYSLAPGVYAEDKTRRGKKIALGGGLLLDRERCVLCTRCVRFLESVTKTSELGVFERGDRSEIGCVEGRLVDNNYSGCLAEICPVGAITDSDFRFKTRAWFLEARETICPLCGRGCAVFLESHPGFPRVPGTAKAYRVRSRRDERVNGHWICNVGRYGYGYLEKSRCRELAGPLAKTLNLKAATDVVAPLAAELRALKYKGRQTRVAVVLSDWLTNEELFLAGAVFRRDLEIGRCHLVGPRDGSPDGMLLTAERSPNRAGAKALGFNTEETTLEALARDTDLLIVFGPFLQDRFRPADIASAWAGVKTKVLFTPRDEGLGAAFDLVVPTVWPAEKDGSFTNCQGLIRSFSPALAPPPSAVPEWRLLTALGRAVGLNPSFYIPFRSAGDVRRAMP